MESILAQILTQWGLAGLVILGAGYIIWDNYKTNKSKTNIDFSNIITKFTEFMNNNKNYEDKLDGINVSVNKLESRFDMLETRFDKLETRFDKLEDRFDVLENNFNKLEDRFDVLEENFTEFKNDQKEFNEQIIKRVENLEDKLCKQPQDIYDIEAQRMNNLAEIAPAIHSILKTSLNNTQADHIFLAIFHNGNVGITGIPYIKFDVIAEKFLPIENPNDHELIRYYKGEDIFHHDKLGSILLQHDVSEFIIDSNNDTESETALRNIDPIEYKRCVEIGVKRIGYVCIKDTHNRLCGFLGAYSFDNTLNIGELQDCASNLEACINL